ncbi:hypothetical protein EMIT0P228_300005 [Pseudomonas brassicacearum]
MHGCRPESVLSPQDRASAQEDPANPGLGRFPNLDLSKRSHRGQHIQTRKPSCPILKTK